MVFVPPLPDHLVSQCDVHIGAVGYENRVMYEFEEAGFSVTNPCLSVKSFHHHDSGVRNGSFTNKVNIEGKISSSRPVFHHRDSGDFLKSEFCWGFVSFIYFRLV